MSASESRVSIGAASSGRGDVDLDAVRQLDQTPRRHFSCSTGSVRSVFMRVELQSQNMTVDSYSQVIYGLSFAFAAGAGFPNMPFALSAMLPNTPLASPTASLPPMPYSWLGQGFCMTREYCTYVGRLSLHLVVLEPI